MAKRTVLADDRLPVVHLYAEKESPKYERAGRMKFLRRYLDEKEPT